MFEAIVGTACLLFSVGFAFFAGLILGKLNSKADMKTWLEEKGCMLCQEKYRNPLEWF